MRRLKDLSEFPKQGAKLYCWKPESGAAYSSFGQARVRSESFACQELDSLALYCRYVSRSLVKGKRVHRRRSQDFLSLEFVAEGELHVRSGDRGYVAERGDVCILRKGMDHELFHPQGAEDGEVYGFILAGRSLPELLGVLRLDDVDVVHLERSRSLHEIRRRLVELLKSGRRDSDALRRNAGASFELLQLLSENAPSASFSKAVSEMLDYLEERVEGRAGVKEMAAAFKCSVPTLMKRFFAETGETPHQALARMRLAKAELLLRSGASVKEAALASGYSDASYFSKEFHRLRGVSPRSCKELFVLSQKQRRRDTGGTCRAQRVLET